MWEMYLQVGVTVLLNILRDRGEAKKHEKMMLKIFRAIALAFNDVEAFRAAAQEAFKK